MTIDVTFKYNRGDKVTFRNYAGKVIESEYTICNKRVTVTEEKEIKISYCFHAYCDKNIGYHDYVDEENIIPLGETHPNEETVEFVDVFGESLEIGDTVTESLYYKTMGDRITLFSLTFVQDIVVKSFIYTKGEDNNIKVGTVYIANEDKPNAPHFNVSYEARTSCCVKTFPDTIVNDIYCAYRSRRDNIFINEEYNTKEFKWIRNHGLYDDLKLLFDKWNPVSQYITFDKKLYGQNNTVSKKDTTKKTRIKKTKQTVDDFDKLIESLTDEEKLEMMKKFFSDKK